MGHRVSISAGGAFPGLLLLSLIPWLGKAALGMLCSALAATSPVEQGGRRGAVIQLQEMPLRGETLALCPVSLQLSGGEW